MRIDAGDPTAIREVVVKVISGRKERFAQAKSTWEPAGFVSRETYCNGPGLRALNVLANTVRPAEPLVLVATVFELPERDSRCDSDEGLQQPEPAG